LLVDEIEGHIIESAGCEPVRDSVRQHGSPDPALLHEITPGQFPDVTVGL